MEIEKKVIGSIPKCYAITPLYFNGREHVLVASEQKERCMLYDLLGNEEAVVWDAPGGVMTMLQIPGTNGEFLTTQKFYSPNESEDANITVASPQKDGTWKLRKIIDLPFVHRFGILERGQTKYLVACTVKSGQSHKNNDWTWPGKVYACVLPEDFSVFDDEHPLKMDVIMDNLVKNHGYYKVMWKGLESVLISCESGVYVLTPPPACGAAWEVERLIDTPASDAVLVDLDGDGLSELAVIAPFHGDQISIFRQQGEKFVKVYDYEKTAPFSHAIYGGILSGIPAVVIGHREGERELLVFTWNKNKQDFEARVIDRQCGSANVYQYSYNGKDYILSANREIDEVALYKVNLQ